MNLDNRPTSDQASNQPTPDWLNRFFALAAFVIALIVYLKTLAPTFSFWDCGEFVACSTTLGIAHPPGSPLYIVLGRLFAALPIGDDVGWRVNLISAISFAISTSIGYLIVRRLADALWGGAKSLAEKLTINFGSLTGALLLAFGLTAWASAVEAEVYGFAMAIYFAIIWLSIAAYQAPTSSVRTRYALLALYLMVLGIGVHMTVALAAIIIIPVFALKEARQSDWLMLTIFALVELYLIFALSSRPNEIPLALPLALTLIGLMFHMFSLAKTPKALMITAGLLALSSYSIIFDIWRNINNINGAGAELPETINSLASLPIGWIGIAGALAWALFLAAKLFRNYQAGQSFKKQTLNKQSLKNQTEDGYLTSFLYLLCAFFLALMTEYVRGYTAFLIITALLGAGLLFVIRTRVNWLLALAALGASGMILGFWEFVHGTLMIIPIITALEFIRQRESNNPLTLISKIGIGAIFAAAVIFLRQTGILESAPLEASAFLAVIAILCILWLTLAKSSQQNLSAQWKTAVIIIILALVGYSNNLIIPVRSSQSPMIDQNNPSRSVAAFVGYIERKQYGSTSMTQRMFTRRAEWMSQFGIHRRMGFWEFFRQQYGAPDGLINTTGGWRFPALFVIGVFGLWELFRRNKALGGILFISLLAGTVGLILYMNFADGSRMIGGADYLEVRDRDYFFTPGFMIFGLVIGLGIIALLRLFQDFLQTANQRLTYILPTIAALSLALPALAVAFNYEIEDRTGNYIPYDYATNLLDSAEKNAILVTGGDNDTFPLWALQAAYGYRRDVAIFNLSLGNTDWYLKQMRDFWNVPIPLTDEQIEGLRYRRYPDGRLSRISEQIIDYLILDAPQHKRPINFSKTIPTSGRKLRGQSIDKRLTATGRAYSIRPDSNGFVLALGATDSLYTKVFSFRGLGVNGVHQDAVSRGMTNSYAIDFIELARIYRNRHAAEDLNRILTKALEIFPQNSRVNQEYLEALYLGKGNEAVKTFVDSCSFSVKTDLYKRWAQVSKTAGDDSIAVTILEEAHQRFENDQELFYGLVALQLESKDYSKLATNLTKWTKNNPADTSARNLLQKLLNSTSGN
ncbi:DUF2723 domain-containing protein [bacterium AH-315-J21]|nr:DUF2723 domain-containing protein [bacterium AH-315-J21]